MEGSSTPNVRSRKGNEPIENPKRVICFPNNESQEQMRSTDVTDPEMKIMRDRE